MYMDVIQANMDVVVLYLNKWENSNNSSTKLAEIKGHIFITYILKSYLMVYESLV